MERSSEIRTRWKTRDFNSAAAFEPAALPVYAVLGVMVSVIAIWVSLTDFVWDRASLTPAILALVGFVALGVILRGYGKGQIGSCAEAATLLIALSMAAPLCATLLASTNLPLADAMLAGLDRKLFFGFERSFVVEWLMTRHFLVEATKLIYHSLVVQPSLLIVILFGLNLSGRAWRLLFAWGLTLALDIALFPLFPALGSPPYFLDFMATFNGSRDGSLRLLGETALTGIITFPSFHAGAAVLLGWGFARVPKVGGAFVVLNTLMFASALIAGHYLIDLVAGGLIAAAAIAVSHLVIGRIESRAGPQACPNPPSEAVRK